MTGDGGTVVLCIAMLAATAVLWTTAVCFAAGLAARFFLLCFVAAGAEVQTANRTNGMKITRESEDVDILCIIDPVRSREDPKDVASERY
jgi:hypothetical protein